MKNSNHFKDIVKFVYEERGMYKISLTENTTLEEDLKITGDDAYDFMNAFGIKFNVNISDFDFSKYFSCEGSLGLFKVAFLNISSGKEPITLRDLEKAVSSGEM